MKLFNRNKKVSNSEASTPKELIDAIAKMSNKIDAMNEEIRGLKLEIMILVSKKRN